MKWTFADIERRTIPEPNTGCLLWMLATNKLGYGIGGNFNPQRNWLAHRYAWEVAHGPIPDGLCVLHRCDTPPCVNPAHLFLGTRLENNQDRHRKGRSAKGDAVASRGERNPGASLTDDQVRQIRRRLAAGEIGRRLAMEFGVREPVISNIKNRRTWSHLDAD